MPLIRFLARLEVINLKKNIKLIIIILVMLSIGVTAVFASKLVNNNKSSNIDDDYRYVIEINGKYGYINRLGKVIVKPQYDRAEDFSEGLGAVCKDINNKQNKQCGFVDVNGKEIIPLKFSTVCNFSEGLSLVSQGGKYFYINQKGEIVIYNPEFSFFESFSEDLAPVRINNKTGFIDKSGLLIIKPSFEYTENFSEGLALVTFIENGKEKYKFIDKTGKIILNLDNYNYVYFGSASSFKDGLAPINTCEYIDKNGKIILNFCKSELFHLEDKYPRAFKDGLITVGYKEGEIVKWGYANKQGKLVIEAPAVTNDIDVSPINDFSEGLAMVYLNGRLDENDKIVFIDKTGKTLINNLISGYNSNFRNSNFSQGLARAQNKYFYGYINRNGKFVWHNKLSKKGE